VTPDDLIEYNRKYGTAVLPQTSTTFIASDEFIVSGEERSRYLDDDSTIVDPTIYLHTTYYVNWREVLWQMQADYRRYGHLNNFE
jgi:hypothetical protein